MVMEMDLRFGPAPWVLTASLVGFKYLLGPQSAYSPVM